MLLINNVVLLRRRKTPQVEHLKSIQDTLILVKAKLHTITLSLSTSIQRCLRATKTTGSLTVKAPSLANQRIVREMHTRHNNGSSTTLYSASWTFRTRGQSRDLLPLSLVIVDSGRLIRTMYKKALTIFAN
jgi:hypothetical protein